MLYSNKCLINPVEVIQLKHWFIIIIHSQFTFASFSLTLILFEYELHDTASSCAVHSFIRRWWWGQHAFKNTHTNISFFLYVEVLSLMWRGDVYYYYYYHYYHISNIIKLVTRMWILIRLYFELNFKLFYKLNFSCSNNLLTYYKSVWQ